MVTRTNLLSYLKSETVSYKEKEIFIMKNKMFVTKVLKDTNSIDLIESLFVSKIPISAKIIISDELDLKNFTDDEISNIENFLRSKSNFKETDLLKKYYPKLIKKYIINNIFNCNIIEVMNSNLVSKEIKKIIIDVSIDGNSLINLILSINDKDIKEYIFDTKFKSLNNILAVLRDADKTLCEIIINRFINENNILDVLEVPLSDVIKNEIVRVKYNELCHAIDVLLVDDIMNVITSSQIYTNAVYDLIFEKKLDFIKKYMNKLSFSKFGKTLCKIKDSRLVNIIINEHPFKVKLCLLFAKQNNILSWLYSDFIPMNIKNFAFEKKYKEIINAINNRSAESLKLGYLRRNEYMPLNLVKLIIQLKHDELIEYIKRKPDFFVISDILYGEYCDLYNEFVIEYAVDEFMLKKIITQCDEHLTSVIIKIKKEFIRNILISMSINEILTLSYFKNDYAKELICFNFEDIIISKLKACSDDELFHYLIFSTTSEYIKAIILKLQNIPEEDIFMVYDLIKYIDVKKVLQNYKIIKDFIIKCNIPFESFLEYGIGSDVYNDWFDKILYITTNNIENDFFKAFKYLMNELYSDDKCKENMVYIILNFLEILSNFDRCYNLIMNLVNNNTSLDASSKENLKYLFQSNLCNIKSLDDLKCVRIMALKQNIEIINNSTSLDELKCLFNNLVLQNSNAFFDYIGGIHTLLALKKSNEDNVLFCKFADNLIKCSSLIEMVKTCSDIEVLRKLLKYFVIENPNSLIVLQTLYGEYKKNIQNLFEIDAKLNLSKVSSAKDLGLLNEELSKEYGGEVYDFRGTNYVLYAHVLSGYEKIDMLVDGFATGNINFISVSPISYLGQKYYYDRNRTTLVIDTIPTGSFICSSLSNMGSNYNISNNSAFVKETQRNERGILETSAVTQTNSEVLLYREGIKVCGLILAGGREPSNEEMMYHKKYNLPFIITQDVMMPCENIKKVFRLNDVDINFSELPKELNEIIASLSYCFSIPKCDKIYTGREIALIADAHSLYEPTLAVLEDIRKSGITQIYSLGDNIGDGANPHEVMELLDKYGVISVAGNSEYYCTLGTAPFSYFDKEREENQSWTYDKLTMDDLNTLKLYRPSIDLFVGEKKLALCHFANDIRWDYSGNYSTWAYQQNFKEGVSSKQFLHTNSQNANKIITGILEKKYDSRINAGILDALNNPIFNGKKVTDYDSILQGHVHFHMQDFLQNTNILSLRAVGMGYSRRDNGKACYYVMKERNDGAFDVEKRLVDFNQNLLYANTYSSNIPHKEKILRFIKPV